MLHKNRRRTRRSAAASVFCCASASLASRCTGPEIVSALSAGTGSHVFTRASGTVSQLKVMRRGTPLHLVELDDLTEGAIEQVIMAAVEFYQDSGSERRDDYVNGYGVHGDTAANGDVDGLNGATTANGSRSQDTSMSNDSFTPSPDSAAFSEAAREEAHNAPLRNSKDAVRAILETENSDDEDYSSRKLSALLAAALLAAAEKKTGQS